MSSHRRTACALACALVLPMMYYTAHIAIGAVYLGQCPRQPYIPIYLLVLGCFCMVQNLLTCCLGEDNVFFKVWNAVTGLFFLCWFITGNVWIYSIYEPSYDKTMINSTNSTSDQYCDKTLYLFAFWTTTLTYIILAPCLLAFGCYFLFTMVGLACFVCLSDDVQGNPDTTWSETTICTVSGTAAGIMGAEGVAPIVPPPPPPPPQGAIPPPEEGV